MTHPQIQAEADAEQVRLVREALALRRDRPAGESSPQVLRSLPGGPRPSLAEVGASRTPPSPQGVEFLFRRSRHGERGREGGEPALR